MTYIRQMLMLLFAMLILMALQYQYWFGENGNRALVQLKKEVAEQKFINDEQQKSNEILIADVKDLKNGLEAVEEHARSDLGLIKSGETFVQMSTAVESSDKNNQVSDNTPAQNLSPTEN